MNANFETKQIQNCENVNESVLYTLIIYQPLTSMFVLSREGGQEEGVEEGK